nr:type I-E CRISPR-associated protein Cas6/Cse3/CasE [Propionibacterium sp.]
MTYLCSVPLNPLRSGAQRLLTNPQRMHAAVEGVLPPERSGRLLWRVDRHGAHANLLIVAPDPPTLDHLVEQAGWPDAPGGTPRVADLAPLLAQVATGREFEFRVRLNPVQRLPGTPESRGERKGHRTMRHQLDWFLARTTGTASSWGFSVGATGEPTVTVLERQHLRFLRKGSDRPVVLDVATFQGILTVTDPGALRRSLTAGIGTGKAYGCGLLTLASRRGHVVAR